MTKKLVTHTISTIDAIPADWLDIWSSDREQPVQADTINKALDYFYLNHSDSLNVVWDLDASVAALLTLVKESHSALLSKLKAQNKCYLAPYSIFYVPNKVLSIKPVTSSKSVSLYNLSQFYPDSSPPADLDTLTRMGEQLLEALTEMNLEANKLTSPVAIFEENRLKYMNLPTVYDMPVEVAKYAAECGGKLWTEAYKIGYWEKAFDYDIESSFPTVIQTLYDTRLGKWYKVTEPGQSYNGKKFRYPYYGFYHCIVTIFDRVQVSPIIYTDTDGSLSTPTGTWKTYLTKDEISLVLDYNIGEIKVIDGYEWCPNNINKTVKPLDKTMLDILLYKRKDNKLIRDLAKRISVGIYGKFGEEHADRFGKYYNPVWFATISTNVRLEVARFIYDNNVQDNLIHVSVDGVLLDKEIVIN